jgi:hypothetical protein
MSQGAIETATRGRVHLGAFVPAEQRAALIEMATREDRSMSSLVRSAIADLLRRDELLAQAAEARARVGDYKRIAMPDDEEAA